jgi:site-specific DNA-methyltransferase (adenine-specific)
MSKNDEWGTPQWLFDALNAEFKFELDVAASPKNHKCGDFFTIYTNGLARSWTVSNWCNPPYSNQMPWAVKAVQEAAKGRRTVMLAMCDVSTEFFKYCFYHAWEIRLLTHRITFEGAKSTPRFASMIVVFDRPKWAYGLHAHANVLIADYKGFKK